jgi:hypothetical protein
MSEIKSVADGNPPFKDDWKWPDAAHLEWKNRLWSSFSKFIQETDGFIPDSRDCHHKYLFEIYLAGAKSEPK